MLMQNLHTPGDICTGRLVTLNTAQYIRKQSFRLYFIFTMVDSPWFFLQGNFKNTRNSVQQR